MTTYLNRPVFDFPLEWSTAPEGQFQYELHEILLGQAAAKTAPAARHTVTGYRLKVFLETALEINEFDAFVDAVKGQLNGFWIAAPFAAFKIVEVKTESLGGTLEFWIEDAKLRDYVGTQTYLAFECPGEVTEYALISSVALESGREHVVLSSDLAATLTPSWEASRLLYARLASDDTTLKYDGDNIGTVELSVIELPEEYAAIETGQAPVFLYEIGITGLGTWYYTNLNASITSQGQAFTTWPINHGDHEQSLDSGEHTLKITTVMDASSPVAKLFPHPTPSPLAVKVWETTYSTPDTRTLIFTGYADSASLEGNTATVECKTIIESLGAQFPHFFIQNRCNYCLFSACCAANSGPMAADYKVTAVITALGGRNVTLGSFSPGTPVYSPETYYPKDYFTFGYMEHLTSGVVNSIRSIESNLRHYEGSMYLTLTAPPDSSWAVGDTVYLYPGCDGTREVCAAKFHNFDNWGGHNFVGTNLSLTEVDVPSRDNKK